LPEPLAQPTPLRFSTVDRLSAVSAAAWDALFPGDYPFARHRFLSALEQHACVTPHNGWAPRHLLAHGPDGQLLGAMPLYLKAHSYGEFVFDFAWAEASHRRQRPYYPKLLSAIPFTPSTGPRIGARDPQVATALVEALRRSVDTLDASSAHALFVEPVQIGAFDEAEWMQRQDLQFHWFNQGYQSFADFAAAFVSDKRKKMLRERRRIEEAGLRFEIRRGNELGEAEWMQVYSLYANTYEERGQAPYLTPDFLLDYGRDTDTPVRLILCFDGAQLVAVALTLLAGDTLYGRHWGAADRYHSLHFECCYYQGIELCIREGLARFDAGTQGEHKLARGFVPVLTRSLHRLNDRPLADAVHQHLARERLLVAARQQQLMHHIPYRSTTHLPA